MKTLSVDLFDRKSVNRAIKELDMAQKRLEKLDIVLKRLGEIGLEVAQKGFDAVPDPNYQGVSCRLVKQSNGYAIYAFGENVCYVEFGAGVHYAGVIPYSGSYIPLEIDAIGYHNTKNPGEPSKGKNDEWTYPGGKTQGIMAYQPLNFALQEMRRAAPKIIEEVFKKEL